jgi:ParB family transcriptional regulator, chromosome partitioning protein
MPGQSIQQIAIADIVCGTQLREHFDEERLMELTQSMRESGQREAIHVVSLGGGKYELIAGTRRLRAARRANWTTIEARIHEELKSKSDVLVQQILLDMQREELTPLEQAKAVTLLKKESGWNSSQIASKLGFSNGTITKLLSILDLPQELQARIRSGELPVTAAYELARVGDPARQAVLASRIASGELKRDDLIDEKKKLPRRGRRRDSSRRTVRVFSPRISAISTRRWATGRRVKPW